MLRIHKSNNDEQKKINAGVEVTDEDRYCKIVNRSTDAATVILFRLCDSEEAGDEKEIKVESGAREVIAISNSEKAS